MEELSHFSCEFWWMAVEILTRIPLEHHLFVYWYLREYLTWDKLCATSQFTDKAFLCPMYTNNISLGHHCGFDILPPRTFMRACIVGSFSSSIGSEMRRLIEKVKTHVTAHMLLQELKFQERKVKKKRVVAFS